MFKPSWRSIRILLLALTLLFSASLRFAAVSQHATPTIASHCVDQNRPSTTSPQQALDCLGHCALPAPIAYAPATLQYRQHRTALPQPGFISIVQTPPSPPPKLSAV
ncbi:hypothetical protein ABHF33_10160 [Chitinibacter sp. FCG-7]|uniref:DUF2946 domain-containing protein n=1 Tax=Chitinibacter mangrovi TaxID=3153927 RepID=A0AAU7F450_9NEIS